MAANHQEKQKGKKKKAIQSRQRKKGAETQERMSAADESIESGGETETQFCSLNSYTDD